MKLTFLGGADEVGASCTLVEIAGKKILVDAGIRISPKTSRGLQNEQLPHLAHLSDIGEPDVILITHAHTDHIGALPQVMRQFPRVPVYGTAATIALSKVLLLDSTRLMETRLEAEGELPLYDGADVDLLLQNWQTIEFGRALALSADLQVTPYVSGHIAGAAMLVFESTEGVLVMSGDVSISPQRTVMSAKPPRIRADALVLESTYGGRPHADRKFEERRLVDTLKQVTESGGKVLIPAFALGRAQEVIQILLAFRDEISVPVYVDGMVRAMCEAYSSFQEILPKPTVKMAGEQPLFFRENVHPVRSKKERDEIIYSAEPKIVIASSGMLTGGASVTYASSFAGDERNAIFLTGYQDAESPGRFLQNVMERKEKGDTPYLQMGKDRVALRCHIGKYSLSAHAAGDELIGFAEAVDAQRVFLVHGDEPARNHMWKALNNKGRSASRPKVGQEKTVAKRRYLAVNRDGDVADVVPEQKDVDPEALWNLLIAHQGEVFSARELAQIWYGDVERETDLIEILEDSMYYFTQDWKNKRQFTVKKKRQVDQSIRSHQIIRQNPGLAGKLVVIRNPNGDPRLAVIESVDESSFVAIMQGTQATNHSGDAFVWSLGQWMGDYDENVKIQLNEILRGAESVIERVLPFGKRQLLAAEGAIIIPDELITPLNSDDEQDWQRWQTELAAVVLVLARDGAMYVGGGLKVERALPNGPVNQQVAREMALDAFPEEARLRKVGILAHKNTLILNFDFPEVASKKYADALQALRMETGWQANLRMTTNQQALGEAVSEVLPKTIDIVKGPSMYMDKREIGVEVEGLSDEQVKLAETAYMEMTGYTLRLVNRSSNSNPVGTGVSPVLHDNVAESPATLMAIPDASAPLEINAAYEVVRSTLEPLGMQKVGQKNNDLVVTFVSPQVGLRYVDVMAMLEQKTGYKVRVHENPMQNIILDRSKALLRQAGWSVSKGPGIHTDRGEVSIKMDTMVSDDDLRQLSDTLEAETGYRLIVR